MPDTQLGLCQRALADIERPELGPRFVASKGSACQSICELGVTESDAFEAQQGPLLDDVHCTKTAAEFEPVNRAGRLGKTNVLWSQVTVALANKAAVGAAAKGRLAAVENS